MNIESAVVHYIKKDAHKLVERIDGATAPIAMSTKLLDLVNSILATYNNRHAKQAGQFQDDLTSYPLASELKGMLDGKQTILDASRNVLKRLEQLMNLMLASTGGHLLFVHYTRTVDGEKSADHYVLIVKLMTVPGQIFRGLTSVEDATHLSVDKLQVAARINLSSWRADRGERYVTFVSTREGGHTSNYFRDFIGCDVTAESRTESKKLAAVIDDFVKEKIEGKELSIDEGVARKRMVFDYAMASASKNEPLELGDVASLIWPPDRDVFMEYLGGHEHAPADFFAPDKRSLRQLAEYAYQSKDFRLAMTLDFKLKHNVTIDAKKLVIENPPADLVSELTDVP